MQKMEVDMQIIITDLLKIYQIQGKENSYDNI